MIKDFFNLFFPNICPLCGLNMSNSDKIFCFACKNNLPKTNYHLYPDDNNIHQIFWGRTEIKYAFAFCYYTKALKIQKIIHLLKYKNKPEIGEEMGRIYAQYLIEKDFIKEIDYIIPVPLHSKKKRKRGYNQSETFANGLSEITKIPVENEILIRNIYTETQTKKSRLKRWENVKEIFELSNPEKIKNKHILIVDDVITTGSTIEACVNEIKKAENVTVSVASIAVAGI